MSSKKVTTLSDGKPRGTRRGRLKLKVPENPQDAWITTAGGWALFPHYSATDRTSPLWVRVKAIHMDRIGDRRRGLGRRAYWLLYGVDVRRFRKEWDSMEFARRFPAVFEEFERTCGEWFTVAQAEHRLGGPDGLAAERARLAQSAEKRMIHTAERVEKAHEAALVEDQERSKSRH